IIRRRRLLDGFRARCQESRGRPDVDVRDEQPWFAVGLKAEQGSVGPYHSRSRWRPGARKIYGCEIAGILSGAAQDRFLVEGVRGIGETRGHVTARLGFVEMRVEHDMRAASHGPADRFWIAPALMADHNAEYQGAGLKDAPPQTGRIDSLLRGIELDFVLKTGYASVSIDDQCSSQKGPIDNSFRAENNRQPS